MRINNELHWRWCVECLYLAATVAGCLCFVGGAMFSLQMRLLKEQAFNIWNGKIFGILIKRGNLKAL